MEAIAGHSTHRSRCSVPVHTTPLHHTLLILITILCLSPAALAVDPLSSRSGVLNFVSDLCKRSTTPPDPLVNDDQLHRTTNDGDRKDNNASQAVQRRASTSSSGTSMPMPHPFDIVSNNFATPSCKTFFSSFLSNSTVTDCHAVSMLLENSFGFFHTLTSSGATSEVLDISCSAPVTHCADIMTSLAAQLLQDDNCGADYQSNNSIVMSAYNDMLAYEPIYRATCLTNPKTQDYCFVDAVNNICATVDYNVYFIPLGTALSSHAQPTCTKCLQATMHVFAKWATVNNQPLDRSYLPSARAVNSHCGADFAPTNIDLGSNTASVAVGLVLSDLQFRWMVALVLGVIFVGYI